MVNLNPKKLDVIFTYSVVSGILLSVFIHTGLDVSETGIAMQILTIVSNTLGSPNPYLIPVISILFTIIEILVLIHYIRQIAEHGSSGIIVSSTGFFGSLAIFLGTVAGLQIIMYIGVGMRVIGILAVRFSD